MSLRTYSGEYLVSPVPIQMSLNWCSHNCWYCFANLNNPDRRIDYASINRRIKNHAAGFHPKTDIVGMLLSKGYPILVANDSDPFSASNEGAFLALLETFTDLGIKFTIQTRGGKAAVKTMQAMAPTMIYISFTSDDNELLKRNEPGAPSFEARKELALACRDAGHFVVIGLNPLVPAWWRDVSGFTDWMNGNGLHHVWYGDLHLSRFQIQNMKEQSKKRHEEEIAYGLKKKKNDATLLAAQINDFISEGINVFSSGYSISGRFWKPYFDLGFPFFPTLEGFFDHLEIIGKGEPVAFTFEYFDKWTNIARDHQSSLYEEYLSSFGRSIRNTSEKVKCRSFYDVHRYYWRIHDFMTVLSKKRIYYAMTGENFATDDEDRDILIYCPTGSDELTYPIEKTARVLR